VSQEAHREALFLTDPVERFVGRAIFPAIPMSDRSALFIASSFGKASATSGLSTTTFDNSL